MVTKLTAAQYRALRRRPDHATLARDGGKEKMAVRSGKKFSPAETPLNVVLGAIPKSKFGAITTEVDGIRFASRAEARRYLLLKQLQEQGEISGLQLQPPFPFDIDGSHMFTYYADFVYDEVKTNKKIIEDVKGVSTPVYKLKKKIIEKYYGVKIMEIRRSKRPTTP